VRFTILSHAGLVVERDDVVLVVDPWIVGSCYWRSWWNLPEPPQQLVEALRPTHVYLTHLHWDHFHGPSLRRFARDTQFIVPTFNNDRMIRDLAFLGFENVVELEHGEALDLGGLALQSYQFLNDSAVTISDGERTILNANDAKLFGLPLEQVLADHPSIDFALRSHSNASAYPYCIEDYETLCPELRPRSAYMDEFAAFAKKVGARYAIPFASNHCFLHPETRQFNGIAVKPTEIKRRFDELVADGDMQGSECVIMAPGSSWSTENGFDLVAFDYDNVEDYIDKLGVVHGETIARQLELEAKAELDAAAFVRYFERFSAAIPRLAKRRLGTFEMRVVEHGVERPFGIDTASGEVVEGLVNPRHQWVVEAHGVIGRLYGWAMFFDRRCPVCGQPHRTVCVGCVDLLQLMDEMSVPWLDRLTPLFVYDDASARLILAAKNGGRRDLLRWVGRHLGGAVAGRSQSPIDVVTWVPAHPAQQRTRGYDQGQVLARAVAGRLGVQAKPLLQRRGGTSQKGLGRVDRLAGPDVRCRRSVRGSVLLVDDVMATGASLERCAASLRGAGAEAVAAAVVAASTTNSDGRAAPSRSTIYIGGDMGIRPQTT